MAERPGPADGAFRTIGQVADEMGVPQHILRYWETRFPQLRPLQRAGNRRYYRPADIDLVRRIHRLINQDGYTVRGVQKLLNAERGAPVAPAEAPPPADSYLDDLRGLRDTLARVLDEDRRAAA